MLFSNNGEGILNGCWSGEQQRRRIYIVVGQAIRQRRTSYAGGAQVTSRLSRDGQVPPETEINCQTLKTISSAESFSFVEETLRRRPQRPFAKYQRLFQAAFLEYFLIAFNSNFKLRFSSSIS